MHKIGWIIGGATVAYYLARSSRGGGLDKMALAIMDFEGWAPGSISYENNNPGNLKLAGQAKATGADSHGHAIFENFPDGWSALIAQLRAAFMDTSGIYNSQMSLLEFFDRYAEENSIPYARFVAERLGVSPEATLESIGI